MKKKIDKKPAVALTVNERTIASQLLAQSPALFMMIRTPLKVESFASTIFDKGDGLDGDINDAFSFMKKVKLKDIKFDNINDKSFEIVDISNNTKITSSNRGSQRGELRGQFLREQLLKQAEINPDLTIYEAIQNIIDLDPDFTSTKDFVYFLTTYQQDPSMAEVIKAACQDLDKAYKANPSMPDSEMQSILQASYEKHVMIRRANFLHTKENLNLESLRSAALPIKNADIYKELRSSIRRTIDKEYGIVSNWEGNFWEQDATLATPLNSKESKLNVERNSMVLRLIARTEAIDQAIVKKYEGVKDPDILSKMTQIRQDLKDNLLNSAATLVTSESFPLEEIQYQEKLNNTYLVRCMYEANLTGNHSTKEEAEKLLSEYGSNRNESPEYASITYYTSKTGKTIKSDNKLNAYSYQVQGSNEVGDVSFLKIPGSLREKQFEKNYSSLKQIIDFDKDPEKQMLIQAAKEVLLAVDDIKSKGVDSKELSDLNAVVYYCKKAIEDPKNPENLKNINSFTEVFSKKGVVYTALSNALSVLSNVAVALAGVLLAVPTFGRSSNLTKNAMTKMEDLPGVNVARKLGNPMSNFKKALESIKNEQKPQEKEKIAGLEEPQEPSSLKS